MWRQQRFDRGGIQRTSLWLLSLPLLLSGPSRGAAGLLAAIGAGILGILCLIALTVYLVRVFDRAGQTLDSLLTDLSLNGERYLLFGRRYRGEYAGRAIEVEFVPAEWMRHPLLNVRLAARADTRIAIFRQWPPLECGNCPKVETGAAELARLRVRATDPTRAGALLSDPDCRGVVRDLFDGGGNAGVRDLYVQPERIWLRIRASQTSQAQLREWLSALSQLADIVEGSR